MEIFTTIAAIVGCILAVINLVTICTKAGRTFIKNIFKKNTKELTQSDAAQTEDIRSIKDSMDDIKFDMGLMKDFIRQQCRSTIKDIYYKYNIKKIIPLYERKTVDYSYELYVNKLGGNSYIKFLYGEIIKWDIDPTERVTDNLID